MCDDHGERRLTRRETLTGMIGMVTGLPLWTSQVSGQNPPIARITVFSALERVIESTSAFLKTLTSAQRKVAVIPFGDSTERSNWHYYPTKLDTVKDETGLLWHERRGLSIKEMSKEQRTAAHAMLRTALSTQGYLKAAGIMQLEEILRETEIALGGSPYLPLRDSELYFFSIFGDPSTKADWGWRIEGHHLSLNFTHTIGGEYSITPTFLGTRPAIVEHGTHAGMSILSEEAEMGRHLVKSFDKAQLRQAVIATSAPQEIVTGNSRKASLGVPIGLAYSRFTSDQQIQLMRLVEEYVFNWRPEFAKNEIERIRKSGLDRLHFAWAGDLEAGKPHYYRIHGNDLLIEYDNTQNNANHIHTVYRDLNNDFGVDSLTHHYQQSRHV